MNIHLKRAYAPPEAADGYRVLVDRLWPRGVSKLAAQVDEWIKDAAPSDDLRKIYHSGAMDWSEFRRRYLSELEEHREALRPLANRAAEGPVTLVYSSTNRQQNNAVVLCEYLRMLG